VAKILVSLRLSQDDHAGLAAEERRRRLSDVLRKELGAIPADLQESMLTELLENLEAPWPTEPTKGKQTVTPTAAPPLPAPTLTPRKLAEQLAAVWPSLTPEEKLGYQEMFRAVGVVPADAGRKECAVPLRGLAPEVFGDFASRVQLHPEMAGELLGTLLMETQSVYEEASFVWEAFKGANKARHRRSSQKWLLRALKKCVEETGRVEEFREELRSFLALPVSIIKSFKISDEAAVESGGVSGWNCSPINSLEVQIMPARCHRERKATLGVGGGIDYEQTWNTYTKRYVEHFGSAQEFRRKLREDAANTVKNQLLIDGRDFWQDVT
jgi:hypothetical protein